MKAVFVKRPKIRYKPEDFPRRPWVVESDCVYQSELITNLIRVPTGYRTDLASVPRVPGIYWRVGNRALLPSIVHDYLFEHNPYGFTRKQADKIFLESMNLEKDPPWPTTRWAMYLAVRAFGGTAWRRYRKLAQ